MEQIKANETLVDSSLRETKMHGTVDFPVGVGLDDFSDFKNGYICCTGTRKFRSPGSSRASSSARWRGARCICTPAN